MKQAMFIGALLLVPALGCASRPQQAAAPAPAEAPTYLVEFRVTEVSPDGSTRVITAPRLMIAEGKEGKIELAGAGGEPGVVCTAIVTQTR